MEPFTPKNLPTADLENPPASAKNGNGFVPFARAVGLDEGKSLPEPGPQDTESEPRHSTVEYVEEEGVVKKIIVTCGCGKVTEIDCLYEG